ncbi:integrase [Paraburkholderia sp. MM5477-R1]
MPSPPSDSLVALHPAPLETLAIPAGLDGRAGTNRASVGHAQIAASNDLEAIRAWLARFADKPTTFESYRKEAERLLLWSLVQSGKPLSSLTHEHSRPVPGPAFAEKPCGAVIRSAAVISISPGYVPIRVLFLVRTLSAISAFWQTRSRPRCGWRWRPFYGPLSPASTRQAMVILNVLFSWLVQAGYLAGNPLALSRQRARQTAPRITRYLEPGLWQRVKDTIASMPQDTARARAHYHRVRWLFTLLYLGGLRIAEVGGNTMGQFFVRRDADGAMRWWLTVHGKGTGKG